MKKIFARGLLIVFPLTLMGCSNSGVKSDDSPSDSSGETSADIDGGYHSQIVGQYSFGTFEQYRSFYRIFVEHNSARFLVPAPSDELTIEYIFVARGISLSDFESKR